MSTVLATTFGLLLYGAFLAPLGWSVIRGKRFPATAYGLIIVALAMYQTGFFQRSTLTPTDEIVLSRAWSNEAVCRQVLRLMEENQLVADLSNPDAPTITGPGAEQVPPKVRDILIDCTRHRPSGADSGVNNVD